MKRISSLLAVVLVLSFVFTGCAPSAAPQSAGPIVVKDAQGADFRLDAPAQKIISLAPSNTEVLFAVGAGKQIIARDDFSNFPEEAAGLPSVGGNMAKYNLEEIARLQPDLIMASPLNTPETIQSLKEITPNVYVVPNPKSFDDLYASLKAVGMLTGHQAEADKLVADLSGRVKVVLDTVAKASEQPKVFYELDATDPAKPWTAGPGTFVDLLVGQAGGKNIGASLQGEWAQISQEELIVQNPDFILLGDSLYGGITPESVAARPGWEGIAAVQKNQVLPFNDDLISRPGPRMVQGLEEMARIMHPDLFK